MLFCFLQTGHIHWTFWQLILFLEGTSPSPITGLISRKTAILFYQRTLNWVKISSMIEKEKITDFGTDHGVSLDYNT